MGDSTWLLAGCGSVDFLESAAHGAGRKLSLQKSPSRTHTSHDLRMFGPVDPQSPALRDRQISLAKFMHA
ncbi:hypothetical protein [Brucella haematophila]|uniref:hypothetical protein n=1 Tax=Brucella haematophila TaxID=419474 RepID=UPI0035BC182B